MIKERPILFKAEMVRAILDGRKTQTRRVVKPQPPTVEAVTAKSGIGYSIFNDNPAHDVFRVAGPVWAVRDLLGAEPQWRCPYGVPGDRLWVRETWAHERDGTGCPDDTGVFYRATDPGWDDEGTGLRWRPSIFMPRSASRILLEITDVRVQRLQEISEEDAWTEGCQKGERNDAGGFFPAYATSQLGDYATGWDTAKEWLADLWESIHGADSWDANPWVWAITFRRLEP